MMRARMMALTAALVLAACADGGPSDLPDLAVDTIEVSPAGPLVLMEGDTVRLEARPKTADGTVLGSVELQWSTEAAAVAELTPGMGYSAVVRGVAPGTTRLHATSEGKSASVTVTVEARVAAVAVSPDTVEVMVGAEAQLGVELRAADGTVLEGRPVAWSSAAEAVATVTGTGLVTARAAGVVSIRAESEGVVGEAAVVVVEPEEEDPVAYVMVEPAEIHVWVGHNRGLESRVLNAAGLPLGGRTVTWAVEDGAVASVDAAGLLRGVAAGGTRVLATSEGVTGFATVKIYAVPVDRMELAFFGMVSDTSSSFQTVIDTTWVDEAGTEHDAFMLAKEGSLSMDWSGAGSYEQTLVLETYITEDLQAKLVAVSEHVDRGALEAWYDFSTGERIFEFESSELEGARFFARFSLPGELRVDRPVGSIPQRPYYFHLPLP